MIVGSLAAFALGVLAGIAIAVAAVGRRAVVRMADLKAAKDRALELLDAEMRARDEERRFYVAKLQAIHGTFTETVRLYRAALAKVAGQADEEDGAPAARRVM